ncbi:MAG: primosomal protein N', partial [Phycisphaerae bacterium]
APLGRGNRSVIGYCVAVRRGESGQMRLKTIEELLDTQPLADGRMLELTRWISERYLCGWGQVLESVIPAGVRHRSGTRLIRTYALADGVRERIESLKLTKQQRSVIEILAGVSGSIPASELCERAQCG